MRIKLLDIRMKVTVIGGSGFVGTNICHHLADRQIPFEILDIRESQRFPEKCKIADIRDLDALRGAITGDVILHLAAVHRDDVRDKSEYYSTNVDGTANIAQVCQEKGVTKIVFTSTVAVYGFAEPGTDETGEINPFNAYGDSKFKGEEKLRSWQADAGNRLVIVRPTVIFGEGNRGNVFNLLQQIASGRFVMVGAGTNEKSMAYIGNITAFLTQCLDHDAPYTLSNYADTPNLDMNTLVRHVRKTLTGHDNVGPRLPYWTGLFLGYVADMFTRVTGKTVPISSIRVKKFCSSTAFRATKFEQLGFEPPFTITEGIERTLHSEFISPDPDREIFYTE
jgi:nucleoside-diphosphate-sugar epimerase